MEVEDLSNNHSTRIWLGDYFSAVDGDTATWQKVSVPIDSFQPGPQNCDFTRIKTIFHYQHAGDNSEHIVWIDEVRAIQTGGGPTVPQPPAHLSATGSDSRIDLKWKPNSGTNLAGYFVYRAASQNGSYSRLNAVPSQVNIYSDFFGQNNQTYLYYVTAANQNLEESSPSDTVWATSYAMTDEELLTSVQEATFRYFYDYGHPVSGMARERKGSGNVCTSGGTGFGLMALIVGAERDFVPRDSAATRVLKIVRFMQDSTTRYHGAWSHWINGETGTTIPFSQYDDGGDLVETSYFIMGALTARQYFNRNTPIETELRNRITQIWETVEWDWYRRYTNGNVLYWHWSPNYGWQMNMQIRGFNEAMIVYLLAIASTTHPVPAQLYHAGWARNGTPPYVNGGTFYGYKQWVGYNYGGPLFFTHYTFMGFDPRHKADAYCNYFDNNRNISFINRAYCIDNPFNHAGYDSLVWGLTASDDPWGYLAHEPFQNDNGTITPTAALSAMPYVPQESMATLKHFYFTYGPNLWGEFGFRDAFNLDQNWFADSYLAIDQGPIVVMIENYRTELCWNNFMANPEIAPMLTAIGYVTGLEDTPGQVIGQFALHQNYPNPFNASTVIEFDLAKTTPVTLQIYNVLGEKVLSLANKKIYSQGKHRIQFSAETLASGLYFYTLKSGDYRSTRRMLLMK